MIKCIEKINWELLCKGCGKCCGLVPFTGDFLLANKHLYQEQPIDLDYSFFPLVVPITASLDYVFLNKSTKRCVVYKNRPRVCRLQGTIPELPCPRIEEEK